MHVQTIQVSQRLSTAEVAHLAGVHKDTLLRWLRGRLIPEPARDRHGWRFFSPTEARAVVAFAQSTNFPSADPHQGTQRIDQGPKRFNDQVPMQGKASVSSPSQFSEVDAAQLLVREAATPYFGKLRAIDWDFIGAKTDYLTHALHPYPAKFIPQIPNALIQELSSVGDTVADIFCGSGTTLVEALTLKRHAIGVDANPLACLISRAKTSVISESDADTIRVLVQKARTLGEAIFSTGEAELFPPPPFKSKAWRPEFEKLTFWFESSVIEEIAEALAWCRGLESQPARNLALTSLSAIVVSVSRQDSDTRYVRRTKSIPQGETLKRFARALEQAARAAVEFSELVETRFTCEVVEADLLTNPDIPPLDLVVCSPPYPNAYSYHLYHMTRMIWLGMDQPKFKREEIGSHRKYSSNGKNRATAQTFRAEFSRILNWLSRHLKRGGYACFVVGTSTLKGQRINNADLISEAGSEAGFVEVMRIDRTLQATKKAFNPTIGKIKRENILILESREGLL